MSLQLLKSSLLFSKSRVLKNIVWHAVSILPRVIPFSAHSRFLPYHFCLNSATFVLPNLRCVLKSSLHLTSQPSEKHCHSPWNPLLIFLPLGCTHSPFLLLTPPFLPKMLSSPELDPESPLLLDTLLCSIVICVSHCSPPPWAAQTLPMIKFHLSAMAPIFMPPVQTLF